jgi:hypothetical protein
MANLFHRKDLELFKTKGVEYYTFILISWMTNRALNKEPVTEKELYTIVKHAEDQSQDCFVMLHGHTILIPLDKLRDSANAAVLTAQDYAWRQETLRPGQYCPNGFNREGFNREGLSLIPLIVQFTLQEKAKHLDSAKQALERSFQASL